MTRWFRKVDQSWRLQRQRQWLQKKRGEAVTPLVQYHLSAAKYQPRLDRQRRRRRPSFGAAAAVRGRAAPAPLLRQRLVSRRHRSSRPKTLGQRLRQRWTAPLPPKTQRGRFIWNEKKHPLLNSPYRQRRRERRWRQRAGRKRLRRLKGLIPKARPAQPILRPQPGAVGLPPERLQQWRRARPLNRRRW